MPRPRKCRRVCCMPGNQRFGPLGGGGGGQAAINMTIDEYEAIRLIDLEQLSQEECAVRMNVARTTAQAIYGSARMKLAKFLVDGAELSIQGGDYALCDGGHPGCGRGRCQKRRCIGAPAAESESRGQGRASQPADHDDSANGK